MGKRLDKIQDINNILTELTSTINKLFEITEKIENKELKKYLLEIIQKYAKLNYEFSTGMMGFTIGEYTSDKIEKDFNNIIKPLKDEMKDAE